MAKIINEKEIKQPVALEEEKKQVVSYYTFWLEVTMFSLAEGI